MDSHRLADDQPIFDQLPDLLTGVGIGDFIGLIGIQPDLLFPPQRRTLEASLFCSLSILMAAAAAAKGVATLIKENI
jgi:hypothetical protein